MSSRCPGKLEVRINDKGLFSSLTRVLKQAISGGQLLPDTGDLGGAAGGKNGFSAERTNVLEGKTRKSAQGQQSFKNFNDQPGGFQTREWEQLYNFPARGEGELAEALPPDEAGRSGDGSGSFGSALAGENSCLGTGAADTYAAGTAAADALCAGADFNAAEGGAGKDEENASPAGERRSFACRACENPDARLCCLEERSPEETKNRWGVEVHTKTLQQMARACEPENFIFNPGIRFKIIGQLHDTFILAEVDSGLLVVDQHVAHERIIYEQLTAKEQILEGEGPKAAQMLAIPVSVSLTSLEEEVLVKNIITLNDMGLILERFGPRSYVIRSLPAGQRVLDPDMFKDLLAQLAEAGGRAEAQEARQRLLVMMSCKQAVKANTRLSEEEMLALLQGLQKTRNPMTCPHGRPIMYLLPFNRLLRAFGRSL
ncbi:MAG: hypothetical protein VB085_10005 [Peptococcaceae bacterium]|nr:hypothetical protein [Peptococcaceae bacterium]